MRTIRRIYLYLVTVISLQTVLWGVINLLRSMFDTQRVGGGASQLASALATIIVGLPVFFLHWWLIQRRIGADTEERSSGIRALFLYGLLLGLLIPAAQNLLAIFDRALVEFFDLSPQTALLGINQTWIDNGIALLMNLLLAGYFMSVLRSDWRAGAVPESPDHAVPSLENLTVARRIFRYALVVYSLALLVYGLQLILRYMLNLLGPANVNALTPLANGIALTVFGALLWWNAWRTVDQSLAEDEEKQSMFRLVLLQLLVLIGLVTLLVTVGNVLYETLRVALGRRIGFNDWVGEIAGPISAAVPFGLLWLYHHRVLQADHESVPRTLRRENLQRLYQYTLSFVGLMVTFIGLQTVTGFVLDALTNPDDMIEISARSSLAGGIAAMVMALPVWIRPWLALNAGVQAAGVDDPKDPKDRKGDQARGSAVRKVYLYLVIFIGVVGVMASAGGLIFQLLQIALGERQTGSLQEIVSTANLLLLFVALLVYHWQVLRSDNRREDQAQAEKHSVFPVLVLDPGDESFAGSIVSALREEAANIPVAVHFTGSGAPGESLSNAGAVVLSSGMAANPPEALRIWLQSFSGIRLVVPVPKPGWVWVDADTTSLSKMARQVARTARRLAEGETLEGGRMSPWVIVGIVFGILFGLPILINLIALVVNF